MTKKMIVRPNVSTLKPDLGKNDALIFAHRFLVSGPYFSKPSFKQSSSSSFQKLRPIFFRLYISVRGQLRDSSGELSLGRFFFERFNGIILALSKNSLDAISDGVSVSSPSVKSFFLLIESLFIFLACFSSTRTKVTIDSVSV